MGFQLLTWAVHLHLFTHLLTVALILEDQELKFVEEPSSVFVDAENHELASFRCSVSPKVAGIIWLENGTVLAEGAPNVVKMSKHRLQVLVGGRPANASGHHTRHSYQCAAQMGELLIMSTPATAIVATLTPFAPQEDVHVSVTAGNTAVVPCRLPYSNPPAVSEFRFNKTSVNRTVDRHHIMPSGDLQIQSSTIWDSGVYFCTAHNPLIKKRLTASHKIYLTVHEPAAEEVPSFTSVPPEVVNVVTGSNVTIECAANGNPAPVITWSKEGGHLPRSRHKIVLGNLEIFSVHSRDNGIYSCQASNRLGIIFARKTKLVVQEPPHIVTPLQNHIVQHGGELRLQCTVQGNPVPTVHWLHNGKRVHHTSHITISEMGIHIRKMTKHQGGMYQCFANNFLGTVYSTAHVTVLAVNESHIPDKNGEDENEPDSINGATENAGKRKDSHKRKKNKGVKLVLPSRPEISRLSDDSVMVRWNVPHNDGLPISFFKVQYRDVSTPHSHWKTVEEDVPPHIHSHAIVGLKAGGRYRFRIVAVYSNNDNKNGPNSIKFLLHKDPPKRKPMQGPIIRRVKAESSTAITLFWEYSDLDAVDVEGFYIYYRLTQSAGDYLKITVAGSNTRSYTVSYLLPDTSYDIKMQCFNVAGASEFSNICIHKTLALPSMGEKKVTPVPDLLESSVSGDKDLLYIVLGAIAGVLVLVVAVFVVLFILRHRHKRQACEQGTSDHNSNLQQNGHIGNGDYFTAQSRITINPLDTMELSELSREKYAAAIVTQISNGHRISPMDLSAEDIIVKAEDV
ncbi:interference hedgehog [Rhipicephalus microplus]|uniref:interference hedgehog n=1 Tax=Rhipicephalus microplus TaxID=6941 RepID=UPI003F6ACF12